jgi:hypothetical protein
MILATENALVVAGRPFWPVPNRYALTRWRCGQAESRKKLPPVTEPASQASLIWDGKAFRPNAAAAKSQLRRDHQESHVTAAGDRGCA